MGYSWYNQHWQTQCKVHPELSSGWLAPGNAQWDACGTIYLLSVSTAWFLFESTELFLIWVVNPVPISCQLQSDSSLFILAWIFFISKEEVLFSSFWIRRSLFLGVQAKNNLQPSWFMLWPCSWIKFNHIPLPTSADSYNLTLHTRSNTGMNKFPSGYKKKTINLVWIFIVVSFVYALELKGCLLTSV